MDSHEPVLLMADRRSTPNQPPEAEPVLVEHDGRIVTLTLDDGQQLTLDEQQLLASLDRAA